MTIHAIKHWADSLHWVGSKRKADKHTDLHSSHVHILYVFYAYIFSLIMSFIVLKRGRPYNGRKKQMDASGCHSHGVLLP